MTNNRSYSALVRHKGNTDLFRAIELSILSVLQGVPLHFHVEGLRGTGKTTIIRAARAVLPHIRRIKGCVYNCHPEHPHCPEHRGQSEDWETEWITMPFVEISHSAKLGTVVGSIDLERLTDRDHPEAALRPGSIAQAHRGIILVDEINRLADTSPELADVLLDVMGTKPGRLQIEETGLRRVELPVSVAVWAASNPDEEPGPLEDVRRQLSDRFDLLVSMSRPTDRRGITEILQQGGLKVGLPEVPEHPSGVTRMSLVSALPEADSRVRTRLALSGALLPERLTDQLVDVLADIYVDFGLESLRAVEAWQLTTQLHALLDGTQPTAEVLARLAPLVLGHRVDLNTLADIMRQLRGQGRERNLAGVTAGNDNAADADGPSKKSPLTSQEQVDDNVATGRDDPGGIEPSRMNGALTSQAVDEASDSEAGLWERLFDRVRAVLRGRTNAAETNESGNETLPSGRPRQTWPGTSSLSRGPVDRAEVAYRTNGTGSPAGAGQQGTVGAPPFVAAPGTRARLLRDLPVARWVDERDE